MIPHFDLFQELQKTPTANFSQLAKELGITDKTAKAHYNFLLKNEYISGVRAKYIPESIGLQTNTYILTVPDLKRVQSLEKLGDQHFFTTFRNRILGTTQGLFMQFDLPANSIKFLDDLMLKLEEYNLIEKYEKIPTSNLKIGTSPEFKFFDNENTKWTWDFDDWIDKYEKTPDKIISKAKNITNVQNRLKLLDIKLLAEITKGSKYYHKQINFAKKFNVSPVQITRRLGFLNENVVKYRLLYSRSKIQAVDLVLFRGKCSGERKNKLFNLIKDNPVPFDSGFELLDDGFLWRMNIPPAYSSLFGEFLWKISSRLNYYRFDHNRSMLYYFYDKNFDAEKNEWKASRKEVFEKPLEWIKKSI
ncbi:winged helix-turn-helix transcriptional regulator [Candidatus Heimdallarchaeota archaeon]|nr:MAG: winged helix-turn-helix transcriptional regulator [Candidatus Heimdallarchaeota archaeon]